jgi:hypothetical protein
LNHHQDADSHRDPSGGQRYRPDDGGGRPGRNDITSVSFVLAVLIFTVVEVVADPLVTKVAMASVPALGGGVALVTIFLDLLVTTWL